MNFDQKRRELKRLYLEFLNLKLPEYSSSKIVSDLIEELLEIDAYYAGIALSVSEGQQVKEKELFDLEKLEKKFQSVESLYKNEIEDKKRCYIYFKKIKEIDFLVRIICCKKQSRSY